MKKRKWYLGILALSLATGSSTYFSGHETVLGADTAQEKAAVFSEWETDSSLLYDENDAANSFEYTFLKDGTVEITKYVGKDNVVVIPGEIDGKKVTSIGKSAFEKCISRTVLQA